MFFPVDECVVQYLANNDRVADLVHFGRTCRDMRSLVEQHSRWSNIANFAEDRIRPHSTSLVLHYLAAYDSEESTPTFMFRGDRWRLALDPTGGVYLDARDAPLNVFYYRTVDFFVAWCGRDCATIQTRYAQLSFQFSDSHGLSCAKGFPSIYPIRREFFDAHGVDGKVLVRVHITDAGAKL